MSEDDELPRVPGAAKPIDVSRLTLDRWMRHPGFPCVRQPSAVRIPKQRLLDWEARRQEQWHNPDA